MNNTIAIHANTRSNSTDITEPHFLATIAKNNTTNVITDHALVHNPSNAVRMMNNSPTIAR
jgi:hypothetical protein